MKRSGQKKGKRDEKERIEEGKEKDEKDEKERIEKGKAKYGNDWIEEGKEKDEKYMREEWRRKEDGREAITNCTASLWRYPPNEICLITESQLFPSYSAQYSQYIGDGGFP